MNKANLIFMAASYAAMLLGICLPGVGEPLRHLLTVFLLVQLLLSFLSTQSPGATGGAGDIAGLSGLVFIKMVLTPLLCWGICALVCPKYSLAVLIVAGVSIGVTAPFFGQLSKADIPFLIAGVIVSSLLLPLTLPALIVAYLYVSGLESSSGLWPAFLRTGLTLSVYIFLPFVGAKALWRVRPGVAQAILGKRYWISVFCVAGCMFIAFSQHALPLRENPLMVLEALLAALFLAAVFLLIGIAAGKNAPIPKGVAYVISMGTANNILALIVATQFFGLPEVLVAAMYSIPLLLLLFPYQFYRAWREKRERAAT